MVEIDLEITRKIDEKEERYFIIIGLALLIPCILSICCCRLILTKLRGKFEIEKYFAYSLAQLHNADAVKSRREKVFMGVGTYDDNLNDWVE